MGYLTTFTVYNDGCHDIPTHAKDFADKVHSACMSHKTKSFGLGMNANLVKCQKTRHADDHTIYVHAGNTLVEMNPFSEDTKDALKVNPEFFKKMLKMMERQVKELKQLYKESQTEK